MTKHDEKNVLTPGAQVIGIGLFGSLSVCALYYFALGMLTKRVSFDGIWIKVEVREFDAILASLCFFGVFISFAWMAVLLWINRKNYAQGNIVAVILGASLFGLKAMG